MLHDVGKKPVQVTRKPYSKTNPSSKWNTFYKTHLVPQVAKKKNQYTSMCLIEYYKIIYNTFQGTNISHPGKRKSSSNVPV